MRYIKEILIILMMTTIISSCSNNGDINKTDKFPNEEAVLVMANEEIEAEYYLDVFYNKRTQSALYEPFTGCYLGAYILSDKATEFDINKFETITEKEHAIYSYYTKLNSPFPTEWILKCISNMKTPNIFIYPESIENPYIEKYLETTSKKYGEFYMPMFINFYPVEGNNYDPEEYKEFYKKAREIFKKNASNVAFVWSVSEDNLPIMNKYYPGDEYVDWVGINIYKDINPEEKEFDSKLLEKIDCIYYEYQDQKPIMISQLGISHFTGINNVYYSKEAGSMLKTFYDEVIDEYPRIKAINYMNYNGLEPVNQIEGKDNYSVTDNENMLKYYKDAVREERYISSVDFSSGGDETFQSLSSNYKACYYQGNYYIAENSFLYELMEEEIIENKEYKIFNNEKYYNIDNLSDKGNYSFYTNSKDKKITINSKK